MDSQEIKAEERNAIFGEIILGYGIFGEASLKTVVPYSLSSSLLFS